MQRTIVQRIALAAIMLAALGTGLPEAQAARAAQTTQVPANDTFAHASVIAALPYHHIIDATEATVESDEPFANCLGDSPATLWYRYNASASQTLTANANAWTSVGMAIYTGDTLANLSTVACTQYSNDLSFQASAGTTYYIQVGSMYGSLGQVIFQLDLAPAPNADFSSNVYDPTIFDTMQFYDQSSDPAQLGIQAREWNFGDGTTAAGYSAEHRYAKDGDYTASLKVTTIDGRSGSTTRLISVRTHDVAIVQIAAPTSASASQTRQITVGLSSKRYPETVEVGLYKGTPNGFELIGTLRQSVPVRSGNRTTNFSFSYTFTSADAALGKVVFKASAWLGNVRDALPGDNDLSAPATKVSR